MSGDAGTEPVVRVITCETRDSLAAAGRLFDQYRQHYGMPRDDAERTLVWLTEMVESRMLTVLTASVDPSARVPVGLATAHAVPASLGRGRFWQVRDLYVRPDARRRGVAAALVATVRDAASAAGASRLSLVTEHDNHAALDLYRRLGFVTVEGLTTLSLDLTAPRTLEE